MIRHILHLIAGPQLATPQELHDMRVICGDETEAELATPAIILIGGGGCTPAYLAALTA